MSLRKVNSQRPSSMPLEVGELFGQFRLKAWNAAGTVTKLLAENDGSLRTSLLAKNSSDTLKSLRVNSNDQLQVEIVSNWQQVDPVILTTGAVAVYNPGSTAAELYAIEFLITNYTATAATVEVGIDLGGGTTYDRYIWKTYPLPAKLDTGWQGPFHIAGDDDVVAHCSASTTAVIHFRVNRLA